MSAPRRTRHWIALGALACITPATFAPSEAWTMLPPQAQEQHIPPDLGDGFRVGNPASQGIDAARLEAMHRRITNGDYGQIHSVVVIRNHTVVFERYYNGSAVNDVHTVQSVTKSVTALLVGIAMADGDIGSVDTPVSAFFPEYADVFRADPRKERITLGHLLTMSHGLEWDEHVVPYGDPSNVVWQMAQSADWMRFVLSRPVARDPGERFVYSSGSSLLLSGILQNATGVQAHHYAERRLFDPLGIPLYAWYHNLQDPKHWAHTGGGLLIRSRDLAKIGVLIVDRGSWAGRQVVPAAWIDALSQPLLHIGDDLDYGYQWYTRPLRRGEPSAPRNGIVHGWGWGGQFVFAMPSLDMVVVFTSGNFESRELERAPIELLYSDILPAVADDS